MAQPAKDQFSEEFLKGQRDCVEGIAHQSGQSEAYDRGYSAQYEYEQMMEANSRGQ